MNKPHWSSVFIRHPLWAIVLSILIFTLGLRSLLNMQIRRFPNIELGVISIQAVYPGAVASLVQSSVTTPLQRSIAEADGIDHLTSVTRDSYTMIQAHLKVGYDTDKAFTNLLAQVQAAKSQLPANLDDPTLVKGTGNSIALMYVAYTTPEQKTSSSLLYNYLNTVVRPQLLTVDGVGAINILGGQPPAMRLWLDFDKMQEHQVSVNDINNALAHENFSLPSGASRSTFTQQTWQLSTRCANTEEFKEIPIKIIDNQIITIGSIAHVELGAENYDSTVIFNDNEGVFLSIDTLPTANALAVMSAVKKRLASLARSLPPQLEQRIVYDATDFINESIVEVIKTLFEALAIVIIVIYAFLGSIRAVIIPLVTIPLSIVGVGTLMLMLGFSINLLTLLAIILAIGLVVDDAIIVVENCYKKIEHGLSSVRAAQEGIAEIASPVVIMTLILAIAYLPMALLQGLTGGLFKEFAFTLSSAVLLSGVVALTLSPMMCGLLLRKEDVSIQPRWLVRLNQGYQQALIGFFHYKKTVVIFAGLTFVMVFVLGALLSQELAPKEDQGFALVAFSGPESATLDYTVERSKEVSVQLKSFPEEENYFLINGANTVASGFGGFIAKPWNQRQRSIESLENEFRQKFGSIVGIEAFSFTPSALPGPDGLPFQVVLFGPFSYEQLFSKASILIDKLRATGYFAFLTTETKLNKPIMNIELSSDRLYLNNLKSLDIGTSLVFSLAETKASRFTFQEQDLDVIMQSPERSFNHLRYLLPVAPNMINGMTLDDVSTFNLSVEPNQRNQFNQLNSITVQGMSFPLFTIGDALGAVKEHTRSLEAEGYFIDYLGPTRSYIQESNQLLSTGVFALAIIYLVLSALFQNFFDPLVILLTVPLALSGTLACMNLSSLIAFSPSLQKYNVTLNIYTQLGLLTLIGLITKHGILIVQVANNFKKNGLTLEEAAYQAAIERFRPILMTTAAMVVGVMPLLFAQGPGAVSRFHLGFVIATGLSIGTFFTLFIIPVIYSILSRPPILLEDKDLTS